MDERLQSLLYEKWTNGACLGYVIEAMENLKYPSKDIENMVTEIKWLFDIKTTGEADQHYCNSPY